MKIPGEYFDQTFHALVGDADTRQQLATTLSNDVKTAQNSGVSVHGQYAALEASAMTAFDDALPARDQRFSLTALRDTLRIDGIARNGPLGVSLSVAALRSADLLYHTHARQPQREDNVQRNTRKLLGAVYGIAQTGKTVGKINMAAYRLGADPRDIPSFLLAALKSNDTSDSFHRSFAVTEDDAGQLAFSPKFNRLGAIRDRRCPAVYSKVDDGNRQVPALWSFINTIGNVAVSDIFPRRFNITK